MTKKIYFHYILLMSFIAGNLHSTHTVTDSSYSDTPTVVAMYAAYLAVRTTIHMVSRIAAQRMMRPMPAYRRYMILYGIDLASLTILPSLFPGDVMLCRGGSPTFESKSSLLKAMIGMLAGIGLYCYGIMRIQNANSDIERQGVLHARQQLDIYGTLGVGITCSWLADGCLRTSGFHRLAETMMLGSLFAYGAP